MGRDKGKPVFINLPNNITGAKFILFRERDSHQQMRGYPDYASKVETTFRFAIKGGTHFLGSDEEPIEIIKMHFDGHKHYHRHLDKNRIIDRLNGLRSYVSISSRQDLIDDNSLDHRIPDSQAYDDCQLLQLTDLLIGSFRTALGVYTREIHKELAYLVKDLLIDYQKGYVRMRNSRWVNSFWLSECFLDNGKWHFESLEFDKTSSTKQLEFW
jgi:hypothetical protein